jgi:nucleotide-binding universal stress UspA family protein
MFKHILVPTDGTDMSRNASRVAIGLAKSLGAKVTAFHAIPPYSPPMADGVYAYVAVYTPDEYLESSDKFAGSILAAIQADARNAGVECAPLKVTAAAPWDAIIKAAASAGCDLIVMASHGRKGIAGLLLGSEANRVLTHSTIPVLICR